jgi:aerobic C4-dicarboxylate transport protein
MRHRTIWTSLYAQVLTAIVLGVAIGYFFPSTGAAMRPLGDGFIRLIKMLIGPIVFITVVVGISQAGAMREVGRIGLRTLIYFEAVSSLALVIGLIVVRTVQPGVGLHISPGSLDPSAVSAYASASRELHIGEFLLNIVPSSAVDAFARGDVLQVLVVSVLCGLALLSLGESGHALVRFFDRCSKLLFAMIALIMRLAPIGAFGAMAFTVGHYGIGTLASLGKLMASVYLTCLCFVFVVLGSIARASGFSIWRLLVYLRAELVIVLGTSSSESVLPRLMEKLTRLGCPRATVGLVVPTGYSFNLDGTSIYMTMAALFVAQATGTHLSLSQEVSLLGILLLTSKGAAAVTGSGFVTLAATLSAVPTIPIGGLALLLGVDRFMSEARALTNFVGNAVATLVVSRMDGSLDTARVRQILDGKASAESVEATNAASFESAVADPPV